MRITGFILGVSVLALGLAHSANADESRTATYSKAQPQTKIEKRVTPTGETRVRANDKTPLNPVDNVRDQFRYESPDDLNEESKAAVFDGKLYTTPTTEQRRNSVPRVQELGF